MPTRVQVSWRMLFEPLSVKTSAIQNRVCTGYHPQNEGKYLEVSPDVFLKKKKRGNDRSSKLNYELVNYLVDLFNDTFNKRGVTTKPGAYLKYVKDKYRVHIQKNLNRYECPPMIPKREWKALLDYAKQKTLKKEGKILPDLARYAIL